MISKQSAMVRTTVNVVFTKMCSHISLPALQLILDVLKQKKDEEDGPLCVEDSEGLSKGHNINGIFNTYSRA